MTTLLDCRKVGVRTGWRADHTKEWDAPKIAIILGILVGGKQILFHVILSWYVVLVHITSNLHQNQQFMNRDTKLREKDPRHPTLFQRTPDNNVIISVSLGCFGHHGQEIME